MSHRYRQRGSDYRTWRRESAHGVAHRRNVALSSMKQTLRIAYVKQCWRGVALVA